MATENRIKFGKTALQALELPEAGKRLTIYDTEVPKLALLPKTCALHAKSSLCTHGVQPARRLPALHADGLKKPAAFIHASHHSRR